ncbi:MAG: ATP-binding protein [Thermodesulfobacteriota bacterium]
MDKTFSLTIRNHFDELSRLTPRVDEFLEKSDVSSRAVFTINFVLEELLTNIIKYGYDDKKEHMIGVRLDMTAEGVLVTLTDDGHAFNPLDQAPPDFSQPIYERKRGGLGIFLLKDMVDHLEYNRRDNLNVIEVRIAEKSG